MADEIQEIPVTQEHSEAIPEPPPPTLERAASVPEMPIEEPKKKRGQRGIDKKPRAKPKPKAKAKAKQSLPPAILENPQMNQWMKPLCKNII